MSKKPLKTTLQFETESRLPANIKEIGSVKPDDLKVYIKQSVFKKLEKMANKDTSKEVGSILLGDVTEYLGKKHVIISNYIEAKYTDSKSASLTFTHETWEYIHTIRDKKFGDKKILGWQHTHPNYGIFLSSYDLFIQDNFFNLPFQVAYVIDPVQNSRGFFGWKNGKTEKLDGFYIYDEPNVQIDDPSIYDLNEVESQTKPEKTTDFKPLIAFGIFLLVGLIGYLGFKILDLDHQLDLLKIQLSTLQAENSYKDSQMADIREEIGKINTKLSEVDLSLLSDIENLTALEIVIVEQGDSLWSILSDRGLDFENTIKAVIGINNLANPDEIEVGDMLLIPVVIKPKAD